MMNNSLFDLENYFFNPYAIGYLVSGIIVLAEAIFVFLQNKRSLLNISFSMVTVFAGIWLTGVFLIFSSVDYATALVWSRCYSWLGIIYISAALYLFSSAWSGREINRKSLKFYLNFLIASIFYATCVFTGYIVEGVWSYPWGFYPKAGPGEIVFLIWFSIMIGLSFRNFYQSYQNETSPARKKQTMFVTLAFVFGVFMGSVDFLGNYGVPLHSIGSVAIVLFSTIIAYTIVNYKLMDIETVLHKTALWILSFSLITVPIIMLYKMAFPYIKDSEALQLIFGLFSFIVFAVYLREFQPKVDHFFQRRKADLEEISSKFIQDMVYLQSFDELIRLIEKTITNALYPQWVDILIYNEKKKSYHIVNRNDVEGRVSEFDERNEFLTWLNKNNSIVYREFIDSDPKYAAIKDAARKYFDLTKAMVAVPLVLNERLLGVINLEKKANLRRYNAVDFHFLTTLKNQSAIAISNSLIYQNIEEQVKARTGELVEVQKQLIQAEKLATVGTLSGGVAHEINNPLTAILTNVQMLLAFSDDDGAKMDKESLELIEEATQRCRTIVQKLMTYAKKPMESDQLALTDLADVLKKTAAFIRYQLEQDGIQIVVEAKQGPYSVLGNQNELEQVLTNLILNARDAITASKKKGDVHIVLSKDGGQVKAAVKDEGVGMPKEVMSKIFDPFFTTKDVGKGLGLGLSICQSIIEKHKGKILVESELGKGSVFTIQLPEYSPKGKDGEQAAFVQRSFKVAKE